MGQHGPPRPGRSRVARLVMRLLRGASRLGKAVIMVLGTASVVGLLTLGLLWNTLFHDISQLPSKDALWEMNREVGVEFVDAQGRTIAVRGPRYGRAVTSALLPPHVANAFIAAEDKRFRQHPGIDIRGILRATLANTEARRTVQGGSTITQQLVKNLFLDQDQTLRRKAQEARLAADLERILSKEEILDLYLNRIYFGAGAYGLDAAAHTYFGKPPGDLTLAEAAMLAGFPKAPSRFANEIGEAGPRDRQLYVLGEMVEAGFVTESQASVAKAQELEFKTRPIDSLSGHALDHAVARVHELLPNPPPDLVIVLTIDLDIQEAARDAMSAELGLAANPSEGAAILIENDTGAIRALIGGRDYSKSQFNRATQAQRQPGSAFKMFVYAAALEAGLTPATVRYDMPITIGGWTPGNYGDKYKGAVTLTQALAQSLNTVAAQVGVGVGLENVTALAHEFGITSQLHTYPSLTLGTDEVTLLDLTTGYGVLAKEGLQMAPYIIEEIRNSKGDLLYSHPINTPPRLYPENLAHDLTGMLNRVVIQGTGRAAQVSRWDVAGKSGTSQAWRDAWFIGYTTHLTGGVWVGNDDDKPMIEVTGGAMPARIFSQMMTAALEGIEPKPLAGLDFEDFPPDEQPGAVLDPAGFYGGLAAAFVSAPQRSDLPDIAIGEGSGEPASAKSPGLPPVNQTLPAVDLQRSL